MRVRLKTPAGVWQINSSLKKPAIRITSKKLRKEEEQFTDSASLKICNSCSLKPEIYSFNGLLDASWEVLLQQAITALVGAALPRRMRPVQVRAQSCCRLQLPNPAIFEPLSSVSVCSGRSCFAACGVDEQLCRG